jgi:nitroreductase
MHSPTDLGLDSTNTESYVEQLVKRRHSCRAFDPAPIKREKLQRLLKLAQQSPSWCNTQPWSVSLVSGMALDRLRGLLSEANVENSLSPDIPFPNSYEGKYRDRRRECGYQLYASLGIDPKDRAASSKQSLQNFRFFGAPHVAIVSSTDALGPYGPIGCGVYIGYFTLIAESMGFGTIVQAAPVAYAAVLRTELNIAPDHRIICGISLGYENSTHPINSFRVGRADPSESVRWIDS